MPGDDAPAARLLAAARALLPSAEARYSHFRVAAVIEDASGQTYPGVNVESVTYGLTLCAERVALTGALARGAKEFRRIAVVAERARPVLPCGACRQLLLEYAPDLTLILEGADGAPESVPLRTLLPRPFLDLGSPS
ncbi:MAG: cytidine deaminase [Candidatus Eiseniibacteriota bacterium]